MNSTPSILAALVAPSPVIGVPGRTVAPGGGGFALLLAGTTQPAVSAPASPIARLAIAGGVANVPDALPALRDDAGGDVVTTALDADAADAPSSPVVGETPPRQKGAGRGKSLPIARQPDASPGRIRPGGIIADPSASTAIDNGTTAVVANATLTSLNAPATPLADVSAVPVQGQEGVVTTAAAISSPIAQDVRMPGVSPSAKPPVLRPRLLASATIGAGQAPLPTATPERGGTPAGEKTADHDTDDSPLGAVSPQSPVDLATGQFVAVVPPIDGLATPATVAVSPTFAPASVLSPAAALAMTSSAPGARQSIVTVDATAASPAVVPEAIDGVPSAATLPTPLPAPSVAPDVAEIPVAAAIPPTPTVPPPPLAGAPVRLLDGAALQALGASPSSPILAATDAPASAIVAIAAPVPVGQPDGSALPARAADISVRPGSLAAPEAPRQPAQQPFATSQTADPASVTPAPLSIGTTAPAGQAFAAAIEAADRQDRLAANRGLAESAAAATAIAPTAAVAATAGNGAGQSSLDMRQQGWPAAMVDHIEKLRDAADATSTRIRVVPDALGSIDVSVRRHDDGGVQVSLVADRPQTQAMLADARPELTRLADERGTRLDVSVGAGTGLGAGTGSPDGRQPSATAQIAQRRAPASASQPDDPTDPADGRVA